MFKLSLIFVVCQYVLYSSSKWVISSDSMPIFSFDTTRSFDLQKESCAQNMSNVKLMCTIPKCLLLAKYGHDINLATRCKVHRSDSQQRIVSSKHSRCRFVEGCTRIATCGDPRTRKLRFCARHKSKGCENVSSRRCDQPGCPGYGSFPGRVNNGSKVRLPRFCGKHRKNNQSKERKRPVCQHASGCVRQPTFGDDEERVRRFCSWHKRPGDSYLGLRRRCEFGNCSTTPSFCVSVGSFPRFCKNHRQEQHIPVNFLPCVFQGCMRRAYYAQGNESASRCRQHRLTAQIHVGKRCQKTGCSEPATFTGRTRSKRFCEQHKEPDHVQMSKWAGRRCHHPEGCNAQPSFGTRSGGERLFCAKHKAATHVNTVLALCTSRGGCDKIAYYGQPDDAIPLFCAAHRRWPLLRFFFCVERPHPSPQAPSRPRAVRTRAVGAGAAVYDRRAAGTTG